MQNDAISGRYMHSARQQNRTISIPYVKKFCGTKFHR